MEKHAAVAEGKYVEADGEGSEREDWQNFKAESD